MVRHGPFLLVLLLGAACADEREEHDKAHGRPELVRVGTIGDRAPRESTLVVHVHADGSILVGGRETTLDGFSAGLTKFREGKREPCVLVRADARLPWVAMQRLLETCAEQDGARIFHAVLPTVGEEEGTFAWPLLPATPSKRTARVVLSCNGPPVEPAHLYWAARETKPEDVDLHAGLAVPVGFVLQAADALCRAGVRTAGISTSIPPKGMADRWSDLKALVKAYAGKSDGAAISVTFDERPLRGGKPEPMPPVERVHGGFAGFALERS